MARQTIVDAALNAYTLEECQTAEAVLAVWLATHPADVSLHEVAAMVRIAKLAAQERTTQPLVFQEKPARRSLAELVLRMPSDYQVQEKDFGKPVGKEEW